MASVKDYPARGKVTAIKDGQVVFSPSNTNYELHLHVAQPYTGPIGVVVDATIRAKARKIYSVPSGGGFVAPIFGSPRTIQGRALLVESGSVVIRAGTPIVVELPKDDNALDLEEGAIAVGSIVNAVAFPGATFELLKSDAGA